MCLNGFIVSDFNSEPKQVRKPNSRMVQTEASVSQKVNYYYSNTV